MKQNGGIFEMVKGSAYENTFFLNFMIYFHTFLSITTSLIWIILITVSLIKFGKNPNSLLRNNGNGTFTDVTKESGLPVGLQIAGPPYREDLVLSIAYYFESINESDFKSIPPPLLLR